MKRKPTSSSFGALKILAGKVFPLRVDSRVFVFQAQKICLDMAAALAKEHLNPEWIQTCEKLDLDPIPEGLQVLNHVLLHLDLEMRRN
jgi:hypothetical protein